MNKKILAFISDGKRFLALLNNGKDLSHGGWFWFTVTGSLEDNESYEEAVIREVKEETNLDVEEVLDLNWGSIYSWRKKDHEERHMIAFVKEGKIKLDMKEAVDYKWLSLEEFVKLIRWDDDKELLKKVLGKALNRKLYFKNLNLIDYRKK